MASTEAQLRAKRKYRQKIQQDEEKRLVRNRQIRYSSTKSFIEKEATLEELRKIEELMESREAFLKSNKEK